MMAKREAIKVGDRVAYSAAFLRSTGMITGAIPRARGIVTSLQKFGGAELAVIEWNDPDIPARVLVANLAKVGSSGMSTNPAKRGKARRNPRRRESRPLPASMTRQGDFVYRGYHVQNYGLHGWGIQKGGQHIGYATGPADARKSIDAVLGPVKRNPGERGLLAAIRPGDRVTIVDRFGKERTGRATIIVPGSHVVLNMGGAHGTPAIADDRNITRVTPGKKGGAGFVFRNPTTRGALFTTAQLDTMRREFARISTVQPGRLPDFHRMLAKLGDPALVQISNARIKFLSKLAVNEATRRGLRGGPLALNPARATPRAKRAARKLVRRYGKGRARKIAGAGIAHAASRKQREHFTRVRKAINPAPRMILLEARRFGSSDPWRPVASTHDAQIARMIGAALVRRGYSVRADR